MKKVIFRIITAAFLISLMVYIFSLSAQTAKESSALSGGFTYKLFLVIYPGFKNFSVEKQTEIIRGASFCIRKLTHFSLYFFMGILSYLTFISYKKINFYVRAAISFAVCSLFSISDEIHQYYIPGRSCEIGDMLIDSSGALLSVLVLMLSCILIKRLNKSVK